MNVGGAPRALKGQRMKAHRSVGVICSSRSRSMNFEPFLAKDASPGAALGRGRPKPAAARTRSVRWRGGGRAGREEKVRQHGSESGAADDMSTRTSDTGSVLWRRGCPSYDRSVVHSLSPSPHRCTT